MNIDIRRALPEFGYRAYLDEFLRRAVSGTNDCLKPKQTPNGPVDQLMTDGVPHGVCRTIFQSEGRLPVQHRRPFDGLDLPEWRLGVFRPTAGRPYGWVVLVRLADALDPEMGAYAVKYVVHERDLLGLTLRGASSH